MMNDSVAAILGSRGRDRRRRIAGGTRSAPRAVVVARHREDGGFRPATPASLEIAGDIDRIRLSHGKPLRWRRERNLSQPPAPWSMPMISSIWGPDIEFTSCVLDRSAGGARASDSAADCRHAREKIKRMRGPAGRANPAPASSVAPLRGIKQVHGRTPRAEYFSQRLECFAFSPYILSFVETERVQAIFF